MRQPEHNRPTTPATSRPAWFAAEPRDLLSQVSASAEPALPSGSPLDNLVTELLSEIDACDPVNAGHSVRVATLALLTGRALGIAGDALNDLRVGALLHDVGKILLPADLLRKPGALDANELVMVRRHTAFGGAILSRIPALAFATPVARWHHERWDGLGYPDRLFGERIPLFARIVSVADTFDAMTAPRSYGVALAVEDALAEIESNAGTQFDPIVARAFVSLVEERDFRQTFDACASSIVTLRAAA
jgi:HD-GYP domain-containing protein (c-di-GMP phosphodiesterase class II)